MDERKSLRFKSREEDNFGVIPPADQIKGSYRNGVTEIEIPLRDIIPSENVFINPKNGAVYFLTYRPDYVPACVRP